MELLYSFTISLESYKFRFKLRKNQQTINKSVREIQQIRNLMKK